MESDEWPAQPEDIFKYVRGLFTEFREKTAKSTQFNEYNETRVNKRLHNLKDNKYLIDGIVNQFVTNWKNCITQRLADYADFTYSECEHKIHQWKYRLQQECYKKTEVEDEKIIK